MTAVIVHDSQNSKVRENEVCDYCNICCASGSLLFSR